MNVLAYNRLQILGCLIVSASIVTALIGCASLRADERKSEGDVDRGSAEQRYGVTDQPGFVPQNDREKALYRMIMSLRAEVASLRKQVGQRSDSAAVERSESVRDRAASTRDRSMNSRAMAQAKRIFAAYDKDSDQSVDFEEWLAMREGEMTSARREQERGRFNEPAGDDGEISPDEFMRWMISRARQRDAREGGARDPQRDGGARQRDGDAWQRDGDARQRDGDARERDGDARRRDGDVRREGARSSERNAVEQLVRGGSESKESSGSRDQAERE